MEFLFSKAGRVPGARFVKQVLSKTFSYDGEKEEGILFEDFLFKALVRCGIVKEDEDENVPPFLVLASIERQGMALVAYNDKDAVSDGLSTIFYPYTDFTEDSAKEVIGEFLLDKAEQDPKYAEIVEENRVYVAHIDPAKMTLSISRDGDDENACNLTFEDVDAEEFVSKSKKIKSFIKSTVPPVLIILGIVAMNFIFYKKYYMEKYPEFKKNLQALQVDLSNKKRDLARLKKKVMRERLTVTGIRRKVDISKKIDLEKAVNILTGSEVFKSGEKVES